jgi:NAD(P)-dependent dehydrogenase (short-subunit alcohol dehydrogenase family)
MAATVLVTGSNRGIGLELCRVFRGRGDRVLAVCRQTSTALDATGAEVIAGVDVTSDADVGKLARQIGKTRIDLLVLNAGILRDDGLDDLDLAGVVQQLQVNAVAPLRVAHALVGALGAGSKIALITSRMGSIGDNGSGGYYGYRMSKAALNAAGVSLARDLASDGVAVVILHPGFVRTDMTGRQGNIGPDESARLLAARMDELTLETTGRFRHANGEDLPW